MSDIDNFLRRFGDYLAKANASKKRGNNDYNPLKAVQNPYDEVNMHSGFIYSLLDTNGEHYQDDLFLRLFLEVSNLKNWFGDTKSARVYKEYAIKQGNIDLYISNNTKHIIIENKIDATDGKRQLARYIESLKNDGIKYNNIAVIYLNIWGYEPNQISLDKWQIGNNVLRFGSNKIEYRQLTYNDDILLWIEKCQGKIAIKHDAQMQKELNLCTLNSALEFYKDIVKIITDKKDNKMSVADFFKSKDDFEVAFEIVRDIDKITDTYLFEYLIDDIQKLLKKDKQKWVVKIDKNDDEQDCIWITEKQYAESKKPFFYFYIYCVKSSKRIPKISCSIESDSINNKIEKILKSLKCAFIKYDDEYIDSIGGVSLCQSEVFYVINIRELEKGILDFIKDNLDLVHIINENIKKATL